GYDLLGMQTLLNSSLNPTFVNTDFITLAEAITAQIQRALEPFDIQVLSSINSNIFSPPGWPSAGPAPNLAYASKAAALNNVPSDGASPVPGLARTPQFGSDDVYVLFTGVFQTIMNQIVPANVPISADFAVQSAFSQGAKPDRMDSGAIVDVNYWINRVL